MLTQGVHQEVDAAEIAAAIRRGQFALPSFAPGGPYPSASGRIVGPIPTTGTERAAIGALYLACMTDAVLSLIRSDKEVIVDGGLAYNAAFLGLLAALRRPQRLLVNPKAEGSAAGAAVIAYEALGHQPKLEACAAVDAWAVPGLAEYHARWRELGAANAPPRMVAA